jgi:REP element-mobilizing transposase RayT
MSEKYKNKYRIKSARLPHWDYGSNGMYFITICTQNREHFFGEIVNGKMHLNEIGKIVKNEWIKTFEMRPDMNLQMGEFVIMPNHFHAIIIIGDNEYNTQRGAQQRRDAMNCVSTQRTTKNKFGPQSKNLASIIRGFKIGVTKNARKIHADFGWQSRYYDHIIRNEKSFHNISNYIINNPMNWNNDKFRK